MFELNTLGLMNKLLTLLCALLVVTVLPAKEAVKTNTSKPLIAYKTTIYTDSTLTEELLTQDFGTRGIGSDIARMLGNAALGAATGAISSIVDLGIQALGQLITMDRRHKEEWLETATKECTYTSEMGTLFALNDFYASGSNRGALDPAGIQFNGVGCLATIDNDTSFYVSCHLNRQKLNRIRDHSKFELMVDTVIIHPYHSHLPNSDLPLAFDFKDRKTFNFKMKVQIKSSWMDAAPQMHKDNILGEFVLDIPIDSTDLDANGAFVYVRKEGHPALIEMSGESFIVPRSYMQIPDENEVLHPHYGTGQYSIDITVEETCELTDEYKKNWRADRKYRKSLAKDEKKSFDEAWKTVTKQHWDESLQSWVVTVLKAPASYSIKYMNERIQLK